MNTLRKGLDKTLEIFCSALVVLMTILATWQVVSRYVFNSPSTYTEELLLFSFVWMGLLGAAYVFGKREHMRMSFLADKFQGDNQHRLQILTEVVILLFAAFILVFGGFKISNLAMGQASSTLQVPMGYVYFALPLSGMITIVYNILNICDITKELTHNK